MVPLRIGNFTFLLEDVGMRNVLSYMSRPNKKDSEESGDIPDSHSPVHLPRDYIRHRAERSPHMSMLTRQTMKRDIC